MTPAPFDLLELDSLIDSYNYADDPILTEHFRPIEGVLWGMIEHYGEDVNDFGRLMAAHLRRVSLDSLHFLKDGLGFSERAARNFQAASLFHDLGKLHPAYDVTIWDLPHQPTEEERVEKRLHSLRGPDVFNAALADAPIELKNHPHIKTVIPALMLYHHERVDGTGHRGLKGEELGQIIKAICIADAKDGDMIQREHQEFRRSEAEALMRMKSLPGHDTKDKYKGAFDDMLDTYIAFREAQTGEAIYPQGEPAHA